MSKSIGYHTRLCSNNTVRVMGGSFGGSLDSDTVNRLVKSHFDVAITQSGRPVFVDISGRQVSLYLSVDPSTTEKGKVALAAWRAQEERANRARQEAEDAMNAEIQDLLDGLAPEEVIRRLKCAR